MEPGWPFNKCALYFIGSLFLLAVTEKPVFLGLCLLFCTTQICNIIVNKDPP